MIELKNLNNIQWISDKVLSLGAPPQFSLGTYYQKHRAYHNISHIFDLLQRAYKLNALSHDLFLAIVFHDIIYDPKRTDNEEKSAELFYSYIQNDAVKQAILETKDHKPTTDLSRMLCELDLGIIHRKDFGEFIDFENKIFKEYQFVDYKIYKEKRVEILRNLGVHPMFTQYVQHRKPSIAVYAGSFNPFHKGHFNILKKAEKIFDKVIIARGVNPNKKRNHIYDLPEELDYRQTVEHDGLLTDFIDSLGYDVTLIRGLRSAADVHNELIQYRFLQDFKSDIKVVNIFCDRKYDHISSSAIRELETFNKEDDYLVLNR